MIVIKMSELDYIYYDFRLNQNKPKDKILLMHCYVRKIVTFGWLSPSPVMMFSVKQIQKEQDEQLAKINKNSKK